MSVNYHNLFHSIAYIKNYDDICEQSINGFIIPQNMESFFTSIWEQVNATSVIANILISIIVWPIGLFFWWLIDTILSKLRTQWKYLTPKQKQWFKTHRHFNRFFARLQRKAKVKKKI